MVPVIDLKASKKYPETESGEGVLFEIEFHAISFIDWVDYGSTSVPMPGVDLDCYKYFWNGTEIPSEEEIVHLFSQELPGLDVDEEIGLMMNKAYENHQEKE